MEAPFFFNDSFSGYNKLGIYAGGFISTDFNDLISGEIGMIYSQKGSKEPNRKGQVYNGYKLTLGYLEFPILVQFNYQKWAFEIGPSIGLLIHSKEQNLYQDDIQSATQFESFEIAGLVGVNYSFNEKWGANLRISNSIRPIRYPTSNTYYTWDQAQYNNVASLAVRYFVR